MFPTKKKFCFATFMTKLRLQQVQAKTPIDEQVQLTESQPHFSEENNFKYTAHRRVWIMVLRKESQSSGGAVNSTGTVAELDH